MATKKKKAEGLSWRSALQMLAIVEGQGKRLALNIHHLGDGDDGWKVSAFELPGGEIDLSNPFPEHAHKYVGSYDHPTKAVAAAESFSAAWLKGFKATKMTDCGCDEITDPPG
jgi:hypothetical protein